MTEGRKACRARQKKNWFRTGILVTKSCKGLACSAGVFRTRECTFSYQPAILDLVNVVDWGEEIFPEGGGIKFRKWARGTNPPLPVKHPRWRQRKPNILLSIPLQNNACTAGQQRPFMGLNLTIQRILNWVKFSKDYFWVRRFPTGFLESVKVYCIVCERATIFC